MAHRNLPGIQGTNLLRYESSGYKASRHFVVKHILSIRAFETNRGHCVPALSFYPNNGKSPKYGYLPTFTYPLYMGCFNMAFLIE